jgi:hypothetical protein
MFIRMTDDKLAERHGTTGAPKLGFDYDPTGQTTMKTYWLSFVATVDGRDKALGVVVTDASSSIEAFEQVTKLGLNPGGEVMIVEVPDEPEAQAEVAKFQKDCLLDPESLLAAGCVKKGDAGDYDPSKPPVNVSSVCEECNPRVSHAED